VGLGVRRVEGHPHPERPDRLGPRFSEKGTLSIQRGAHRLRRGRERRLDGITDLLERDPTVAFDRVTQYFEVPVDRGPHRRRVAFPALGAGLDVREEERDRPARQVCHRLLSPATVASLRAQSYRRSVSTGRSTDGRRSTILPWQPNRGARCPRAGSEQTRHGLRSDEGSATDMRRCRSGIGRSWQPETARVSTGSRRRVLPTPPGPVSVRSRTPCSVKKTCKSSSSHFRPTSGVMAAGRLPTGPAASASIIAKSSGWRGGTIDGDDGVKRIMRQAKDREHQRAAVRSRSSWVEFVGWGPAA
jgi:hypothetical protein